MDSIPRPRRHGDGDTPFTPATYPGYEVIGPNTAAGPDGVVRLHNGPTYPQATRDGIVHVPAEAIDNADAAGLAALMAASRLPEDVRATRAAIIGELKAKMDANPAGTIRLLNDMDRITRNRLEDAKAYTYAARRTEDLTRPERTRPPHLRLVGGVGALVAAAILIALSVVFPSSAQAATVPAVKGPGLTLKAEGRAVHVGPYRLAGHLLYCLDWGLQVGDGPVTQGTAPARFDAETRARIAVVVNSAPASPSNIQAARTKLTLDTIVAPFDARLRKALPGMLAQVSAADRAAITAAVEASKTHAPWKVTTSLPGAVTGQPGEATVTVLGSNGKPAQGVTVTGILTGAATRNPVTAKTDANGRAVLRYTAAKLAQSVDVTVTGPSAGKVWINTPTRGHQLMVGGGFTDTAKSSAAVTVCPMRVRISTDCACGQKTVDVEAIFTGLRPGSYLATISVDGKPVHSEPLTGTGQQTIGVTVPVGSTVTASFAVLHDDGGQIDGGTLATVSIR